MALLATPSRLLFSLRQSQSFHLLAIPAISINIPSSFADIWDSVLRAVPKKKTSYGKKRSRQLAGKALKDITAINKCPACGSPKRSHLLCPDCVKKIQKQWHEQKDDSSSSSSSSSPPSTLSSPSS